MKVHFEVAGERHTLDLDPVETWDNVAAILEATVGVPMDQQAYTLSGAVLLLTPADTLASTGVRDGDVVTLSRRGGGGGGSSSGAAQGAPAGGGGAARVPKRGRRGGGALGGGLGALLSRLPPPPKLDPSTYPSLTWEDITSGVPAQTIYDVLRVNPGMMSFVSSRGGWCGDVPR
jgi:hypothetical protein